MLRKLALGAAKVAPWKLEPCIGLSQPRWYAGGAESAAEDTGWLPWLRNKLPGRLPTIPSVMSNLPLKGHFML